MAPQSLERWVVLLAHGSRDQRWKWPLERLRERLQKANPDLGVELAFLQFCQPSLSRALETCREKGAVRVGVIPIFLSGGGHLLRDVPQAISAAATSFPTLQIDSYGALGEEPEVLAAMAKACSRLLRSGEAPPED